MDSRRGQYGYRHLDMGEWARPGKRLGHMARDTEPIQIQVSAPVASAGMGLGRVGVKGTRAGDLITRAEVCGTGSRDPYSCTWVQHGPGSVVLGLNQTSNQSPVAWWSLGLPQTSNHRHGPGAGLRQHTCSSKAVRHGK